MFSTFSFLDFFGATLSLLTTYFYIRANTIAWKLGIVATTLNTILYITQGIYGQAVLEGVYFVTMWYGLKQWQQQQNSAPLPITSLTAFHAVYLFIIVSIAIPCSTLLLQYFAQSDVALWDATICVFSLIAQWLLCKKILQNWMIWFVVDAMIIGMHYYKGIPYHAIMHGIYLMFAIAGYLSWQRKLKQQSMPATLRMA